MDIPYEPGSGLITGSGITGSGSAFDWSREDAFWHGEYLNRDYVLADRGYAFYQPAFRYGSEAAATLKARDWGDVEMALEREWPSYQHRAEAPSEWSEVRHAVRDAWERIAQHRGFHE